MPDLSPVPRTKSPTIPARSTLGVALLAVLASASCSRTAQAPGATTSAGPGGGASPDEAASSTANPLETYIHEAGAFLTASQNVDGSWPYFHSRTPGFEEPEAHASLFGTMMTLTNLEGTPLEASPAFERGAEYVRSRMEDDHTWSLFPADAFSESAQFEPDADDTAVGMTLLWTRLSTTPHDLEALRSVFDRNRAANGLYRTYFAGHLGARGFVPDPNHPSLGVNLNVLGFFGRYGLERTRLAEAIRDHLTVEGYWESTPYYRSLPVLAGLAANALDHGASEADGILRRILADLDAMRGQDFVPGLGTVELASWVRARSRLCLIDRSACPDVDMMVYELARRRTHDGSWPTAAFYEYAVNPDAVVDFVERRDYTLPGPGGRVDYDVERALAAPGTIRYYDGSPAETTSFALKALVVYSRLLDQRPVFLYEQQARAQVGSTAAQ